MIPKEKKTETDVSETQDNEKNNTNTQVADTAKENSTEKKSEDKKDSSEYEDVCFICRRPESKAGRMFKLPNHICICDDCMHKTMETVSQFDYQGMLNNPGDLNQFGGQNGFPNISFVNLADLQGDGGIPNKQKLKKKKKAEGPKPVFNIKDIPAPHKIKASLDEYVVGQEKAKKVISVAVYNHYKRVATDTMDAIEIEKSNILMIGPTGSGKTYLVKTLAKLLDVPLAIADATSLTEAGYIGDDIESVVSKLLAAAGNDVEKAEKGIIFIDEIDKIAKKKNTNSRDVSGESVQQGMLKLLEGAEVEVPVGANSKNAMVPLATVNTRNILFICGGAFPDLDEIIKERLTKTASIGFNSELKDKYDKDTDILSKVTVEDIRKFGMIPEFIGRLPIICTLQGLSKDMLVKILKEPKNAILKQYQKLLELDEVKLEFTDDALDAMKDKVIIIASAEGLGQGSGKSQFFTCLFKMCNYRSILWDVISNKADIRCYLYSCTHFFCCLLKSPGKLIHQRQCFFMAVTADLAFAGTQFRDNVRSLATGNLSDIQRRIFIHLSLLDPADG